MEAKVKGKLVLLAKGRSGKERAAGRSHRNFAESCPQLLIELSPKGCGGFTWPSLFSHLIVKSSSSQYLAATEHRTSHVPSRRVVNVLDSFALIAILFQPVGPPTPSRIGNL